MSNITPDGAWDYAEISTAVHDELVLHLLKKDVATAIIATKIKEKEGTKVVIKEILSEYVVGRKFIHGYIDVVYKLARLRIEARPHRCSYIDIQKCVYDNDGECTLKGSVHNMEYEIAEHLFCIEVKPKVSNFGSLLRQINKYKANINDSTWVVYTKECPDDIVRALDSQGVGVILHKV